MDRVHGFTLIELLVVVFIIVVLAMMLVPVYDAAIKRAEGSVCLVNLRNITQAVHLYADDWDERCVPARVSWPRGSYGTCWEVLLQPYLRSSLVLLCPSDPMPSSTLNSVSLRHSYGINYAIAMVGGYNGASLPLAAIAFPDRTILFFDLVGSSRTMGANAHTDGLRRVDRRHGQGANFAFVAGNCKHLLPETTLQSRGLFGGGSMWEP